MSKCNVAAGLQGVFKDAGTCSTTFNGGYVENTQKEQWKGTGESQGQK